ncbi:putative nucleic acid-binding Zn-ribbon protein [Nakamurella sp. UYEF19]|uniref:zinc ribbon domain-containing protein n=1 Tax=Nakamurella sp. UYEF19 TaxID=1756392 RepID=UPI00339AF2BB
MPKADPFAQRRLLDLAGFDQSINAAEHRRATLPELAVLSAGSEKLAELRNTKVLAETEVGDLQRANRKLDNEIDQVRARSERDAQRLAAGAGNAKDLENLQHEITSLGRRQGVLEDEALELMEQKENADAALAEVTAQFDLLQAEVTAAAGSRDDKFADIDDELKTHRSSRAELLAALPADLVALYERIRKSGKVAAAKLNGGRCEACRMDLDRVELSSIAGAPSDEVVRCPECGAILIRW